MQISLNKDSDLSSLLEMNIDDLIELAFSGADGITEARVATVFDMFHKMFHDYNWGDYRHGCSDFNRMLAIAYIMGKNSRDATEQPMIFGSPIKLFTKDSLEYVLSEQAEQLDKVFDSLPRDERDALVTICRRAFEDRMKLAYEEQQPLTTEVLFSAAMDGLIILRQLQTHALSANGLGNFVNFTDET